MNVAFDPADLRPIVTACLAEIIDRFGDPSRLAFREDEAAALIGQKPYTLRDARLRGEIAGAKVGRGYVYTRAELVTFLEQRRKAQEEPARRRSG
jgi:hypothetical protein